MCFSSSAGGRPVSSIFSLPFVCERSASANWVAPVDLRAVPPVAVVGEEDRGAVRVGGRVGPRALDLHRVIGPRVVVCDLDLPRILLLALAVAEPVVHLELDPRSGEQVERRRRLELVACQELAADQARVRVEDLFGCLGFRVPERNVAAEPAALRPHQRIGEIVVRAVDRARVELALVRRRRRAVGLAAARVVEVLLAQPVTQADQRQQADGHRQAVPPDPLVDLLGEAVEERREPRAWHRTLLSLTVSELPRWPRTGEPM